MSNKMYSPKQVYNLGVAIISHFSTYNYSVDSAPDVIWLTNLSKIFDVFLTRVSIKKQKLLLKYLKDKNVLLYDHFVHYLTGYWAQSIGILADLRGMPINRIYLSKLSNSLNNVTNSVEKEKTKQYQDENVKEMLIEMIQKTIEAQIHQKNINIEKKRKMSKSNIQCLFNIFCIAIPLSSIFKSTIVICALFILAMFVMKLYVHSVSIA